MADESSDARQAVRSDAMALGASIGEHPAAAFLTFALAHAAIWTILPYALYANLPLDLIEALTYGREWQLRRSAA
jgi:hypothetical protein